jgi:hypothetical protein
MVFAGLRILWRFEDHGRFNNWRYPSQSLDFATTTFAFYYHSSFFRHKIGEDTHSPLNDTTTTMTTVSNQSFRQLF